MCYPGIPTSAFVIPLGDPDAPEGYALVSPEDFDKAASIRWLSVCTNGNEDTRYRYAMGRSIFSRDTLYLHRLVSGATDSDVVCDHLNGDTLDSRRANIRLGDYTLNNNNRRPGRSDDEMRAQRRRHAAEATREGVTVDGYVDPEAPCLLLLYLEGRQDHNTVTAQNEYERQMRVAWDRTAESISHGTTGWCAVIRAEAMNEAEWAADYLLRSIKAHNQYAAAAERFNAAGQLRRAKQAEAKAREHMKEVKRANDLLQHHLSAATAHREAA